MKQADKRWRGFTLIEILLVAVILAVIAVLAVPNFSRTYAGIELQKTAQDLAYRMRYAQSYAATQNRLIRLEFDSSLTQYWLARQSAEAGETKEGDIFERVPGRLGESITIPRGIQLSFEGEDVPIYFYPDGAMDKRRVHLCRGLPAGRAGPAQRDRQECVFVSTKEQRGYVHVFKASDERPYGKAQ